jgi:L-serine dehydratase
MTCDPIGGLVQIPVHRAQRLRRGQGDRRGVAGAAWRRAPPGFAGQRRRHHARQTGADMQSKYKETSLGGLAVNFIEC